jgi:hypothetical protein
MQSAIFQMEWALEHDVVVMEKMGVVYSRNSSTNAEPCRRRAGWLLCRSYGAEAGRAAAPCSILLFGIALKRLSRPKENVTPQDSAASYRGIEAVAHISSVCSRGSEYRMCSIRPPSSRGATIRTPAASQSGLNHPCPGLGIISELRLYHHFMNRTSISTDDRRQIRGWSWECRAYRSFGAMPCSDSSLSDNFPHLTRLEDELMICWLH